MARDKFPWIQRHKTALTVALKGKGTGQLPASDSGTAPGRGSVIGGESASSHDRSTRPTRRVTCAISRSRPN